MTRFPWPVFVAGMCFLSSLIEAFGYHHWGWALLGAAGTAAGVGSWWAGRRDTRAALDAVDGNVSELRRVLGRPH